MKLPFTIHDSRFTIRKKSPESAVVSPRACAAGGRKPAIVNQPSRSGIALVITLILLSVTLVMAVAFLAISNRERSSVTTTTDAATARLAAEAALAQAESQILSTMLATTNRYNYGLIVSTNYINPNGYSTALGANPENVNYDYYNTGPGPLSAADLQQNIANLFYLPRAPVFIVTNQSSGATDFRFYLDLNRNGQFDTNGYVPNVDNTGASNGPPILEVGDPEWIGVLERPDTTHGPNNKFVSRYTFLAIPVGNTLDVNYIHNQSRSMTVNPAAPGFFDGFFRNEGVGSWEINLAAFLTDLNTNQWVPPPPPTLTDPYAYLQPNFGNTGRGFEDALSILNYRYSGGYNTLAVPPANAFSALVNAGIDSYTYGNLMTNAQLPVVNPPLAPAYWVGSDNANHFFTPEEIFSDISQPFANSLLNAGTSASTYDRYTFYRMLSQLGTDSTAESGMMNVNYDNIDPGSNGVVVSPVIGSASVTNYVPWTPAGFFANAADRMLRLYTTNWFLNGPSNYLATYYGISYTNPISFDQYGNVSNLINAPFFGMTNQVPAFGLANIPVLVNGQFVYSSAVNRVLQLAANIYDAAYYTNHTFGGTAFPSVFKPVFGVLNSTNVYITNFVEVADTGFLTVDPILNINYGPSAVATLQNNPNALVFGVPLIVGAKKGFPNFNQFYMENTFQLTRKLMVTRLSTNVPVPVPPNFFSYYEQFSVGLSNQFGVEMWNSYRSNYTRPTAVYVTNYITMTLTNDEDNFIFATNLIASGSLQLGAPVGPAWSGYNPYFPTNSFQIPLATNFAAVPGAIYLFNNFAPPQLTPNQAVTFQTNYPPTYGQYPQPHWGLTITNNLQVIVVDEDTGRLIDYVQLSGPNTVNDLTAEIQQFYDTGGNDTGYNNLWNSTLYNGVPLGISEQLKVSQGGGTPIYSANLWGEVEQTAYAQMNAFRVFTLGKSTFLLSFVGYVPDPAQLAIAASTNAMQAPYTPTATVVQDITWQANDPLVHYLASDLNNPAAGNGLSIAPKWPGTFGINLNTRYMPWGGNPLLKNGDTNAYDLTLKDPLIYSSDDWDFPTNKFPTVGWLGRVHRGTPWQTVYLKASNILKTSGINTWINRTGNVNPFDATNTAPLQDRLLFDLFTTAPDDNATRGQLSVNVGAVPGGTSLAAWSALFGGMVVLTNTAVTPQITGTSNSWMVISPAGAAYTNSPLGQLVLGINAMRALYTNADGVQGAFEHKGDILATPQLTEQSPFLNTNTAIVGGNQLQYGISDEMYEWLPQQAMSLLRAPSAPRYVIYCYGQALKPAPNGIVTSSGPFFQMCTNYQVVTESAARAVIRVEGANTPSPHIIIESFNLLPPD
jgi:hypothetical protein